MADYDTGNIVGQIADNPEAQDALTNDANSAYTQARGLVAQAESPNPPAWFLARQGRIGDALMQPGVQQTAQAHHEALADAEAAQHIAEGNFQLINAARTKHDTAGFLTEAHGLDPTGPDYESQVMNLHAKYPFNRVTAEQMEPLNSARRLHQQATASLGAARAQEHSMEHVWTALDKKLITPQEIVQARNEDGSINVPALRMLAAQREPQSLTEYDREVLKQYPAGGSPAEKKLLAGVAKGDQASIAANNALWTARKKADPGLAARLGEPSGPAGAPAATGTPTRQSFTGF